MGNYMSSKRLGDVMVASDVLAIHFIIKTNILKNSRLPFTQPRR